MKYEHWVRDAFWREHLLFHLFPLGGITDFLGRFLKHQSAIYHKKKISDIQISKS
jgi:hypothetical protein